MNLHDTLPVDLATQGVCSTLKEPASPAMLVVVVDVVAVEVVVVVATLVVVDVVAIDEVVVTGVGEASPPPQPAAAATTAAISAARPCARHGNPRVPDAAIICPPWNRLRTVANEAEPDYNLHCCSLVLEAPARACAAKAAGLIRNTRPDITRTSEFQV
jgi:hypothetical protein